MTSINIPLIFLKSALNFTNRKETDFKEHITASIHFRIDRVNNQLNMAASNGHMAALWNFKNNTDKYPLFELSATESDHNLDFSITIDKGLAYSINALKPLKSNEVRSLVQINTDNGTIQYLDTVIAYSKSTDNVNYSKIFKVMAPNTATRLLDAYRLDDLDTLIDPIQQEITQTFNLEYLLDVAKAVHTLRNYSTDRDIKPRYFDLAIESPGYTGGIGRVHFSSDEFLGYHNKAVKPDFAVEFFGVIMPMRLNDKGQGAVNTREDYQKFVEFFK